MCDTCYGDIIIGTSVNSRDVPVQKDNGPSKNIDLVESLNTNVEIEIDYESEDNFMEDLLECEIPDVEPQTEIEFIRALYCAPLCYLCGLTRDEHNKYQRHKFMECTEQYRCTKCKKFFYEHKHNKNSCYSPPSKR